MMSNDEQEQGVAFQVAIGGSPVEALTQPPELPHHLRMRLQSYASSRPHRNLNDRMEAAERRRQRQIQRRAQNAREAEERCRRLTEAVDIVTNYRHFLKGEPVHGQAPNRAEVKAMYANIQQDLQAVLGRVNRETQRLTNTEYVHEPVTYRPKRRVSHTASCTCECCYLEDDAKKEAVKKDLSEILTEMSSPESPGSLLHAMTACSPASDPGFGRIEFAMEVESAPSDSDPGHEVRSSAPIVIRGRPRGRRRVTWLNESTEEEDNALRIPKGLTMAIQTEDMFCGHCNALSGVNNAGWAGSVPQMKDAACQTEPEIFVCPCCRHDFS